MNRKDENVWWVPTYYLSFKAQLKTCFNQRTLNYCLPDNDYKPRYQKAAWDQILVVFLLLPHNNELAVYSAFLTFLLRVPSLSSSLDLEGEAGAAAAAGAVWWWLWASSTARGDPKSRWDTQDSTRAKGDPWEWRAVMTTYKWNSAPCYSFVRESTSLSCFYPCGEDPTLEVAMKRVKRQISMLFDTGIQCASWSVNRMAPYRLALVGLQMHPEEGLVSLCKYNEMFGK